MTLRTILWICLAASAVLFLLTFLMQVHRLRRGFNAQPGRFRVFINWLLIIIFIGSLGGLIWTRFSTSPANGSVASSSSSSSSSSSAVVHHHNHYSRVSWKPADLVLNENGEAKATFKIPAGTKVKIIGQRTQTVYKVFRAKKDDRRVKYTFKYAARYQIAITDKHGNHQVKELTVRDNAPASSSSVSSSISSSSSSVSQSSSTPAATAGQGQNTTGISRSNNYTANANSTAGETGVQGDTGGVSANNVAGQGQ